MGCDRHVEGLEELPQFLAAADVIEAPDAVEVEERGRGRQPDVDERAGGGAAVEHVARDLQNGRRMKVNFNKVSGLTV